MTKWGDIYPPHPACEVFPMMGMEEMNGLVESIARDGMHEPILLVKQDGKDLVLDGRNRLEAAQRLAMDLATIPKRWVDPESVDLERYVIALNLHRRHLNAEQKREVIRKMLELDASRSDRQIAADVGVDHKTVGTVREQEEGRGEIPHLTKRTDARGRKQPARKITKPKPGVVDPEIAEARERLGMPPEGPQRTTIPHFADGAVEKKVLKILADVHHSLIGTTNPTVLPRAEGEIRALDPPMDAVLWKIREDAKMYRDEANDLRRLAKAYDQLADRFDPKPEGDPEPAIPGQERLV